MEKTTPSQIESAYYFFNIILAVYIISMIIGGIVCCVKVEIGTGLGILFGGVVSGAIGLYFAKILFGVMYDAEVTRMFVESIATKFNCDIDIDEEKSIEYINENTEPVVISNSEIENIDEEILENLLPIENDEKPHYIRCYNCKGEFVCYKNQRTVMCPKCGAVYDNPYYKE